MPHPDDAAHLPTSKPYHHVLLVWEEVPEETKVYVLNVGPENFQRICKCHSKFVNLVDNSEEDEQNLLWLAEFIQTNAKQIYGEQDGQRITEPYLMLDPCTVVVSGFIL